MLKKYDLFCLINCYSAILLSISLQAINGLAIELVVQCCAEYPLYSKPHVLVRCNESDSTSLNQQLRAFVDSAQLGEPLIMSLVQWLQDNLRNFAVSTMITIRQRKHSFEAFRGLIGEINCFLTCAGPARLSFSCRFHHADHLFHDR